MALGRPSILGDKGLMSTRKAIWVALVPTLLLVALSSFFVGRDSAPDGVQQDDLVEAGVSNCINGFVTRFVALDQDSAPFFTAEEKEELTKISIRCNEEAVKASLREQYPALYQKMVDLGVLYNLDD